MVGICINFYLAPSPSQGMMVKVIELEFSLIVGIHNYIAIYQNLLVDFINIYHDGKYISKDLHSTIPFFGKLRSRSQIWNFHIFFFFFWL